MEQESQKRKLEETSHEPSNTPILCANNCGFFGSSSNNNLCSKCYKVAVVKQSKNKNPIEQEEKISKNKMEIDQIKTNPVQEVTKNDSIASHKVVVAALIDEGASSKNPEKRPANQCCFCRKQVGLTGFKCRCGQTFCSLHRYSDKHNCVFDYKSAGQDAITTANPVVKAGKIKKI